MSRCDPGELRIASSHQALREEGRMTAPRTALLDTIPALTSPVRDRIGPDRPLGRADPCAEDDHEAVTVNETADIVVLTHANTKEIRRLAGEQAEILAAQDRVLAQQTELLTLLRGHIAGSKEARGTEVASLL